MKQAIYSLLLLLASVPALAQTAVYKCSENGTVGYCHGPQALSCAYQKCVNAGGKSPQQVYSSPTKGYGAIATGRSDNNGVVIGVASGYQNVEEAKKRAEEECRNSGGRDVHTEDWWNDY